MADQEEPIIVRTAAELQAAAEPWRRAGERIALVPTMGALHHAHMTLVEKALGLAERTMVSIFVNPKQFGPAEDFDTYPRREEEDLRKLREAGVDLVFMPAIAEMYPPDFAAEMEAGPMADVLCGKSRPGHFDGVVTVVAQLFRQTGPDLAVFGEKDFQQLQIFRALVEAESFSVEIVGAHLVRDPDGLAISSRNTYLSEAERQQALNLPVTLSVLSAKAAAGEPLRTLEAAGTVALGDAGLDVEYLEFRYEHNLEPAEDLHRPARLFAAVRVGTTRLIDNMPVAGA